MKQPILLACLAALALGARAEPLPFFGAYVEATAVAVTADGAPEADTQSSVSTQPVSASAASVGVADVATAGAIAGHELLTTSVDASAASFGSAVATARFSGVFLNAGPVFLDIGFDPSDFAGGSGSAATTLFVSLVSDGVSLFRDYVQGPWQFSYTPVLNTTSLLDLTLSSEASAAFVSAGAGDASAFGTVTIAGTVPEASTWLMFGLGLGAVGFVKTRARRRAQAA